MVLLHHESLTTFLFLLVVMVGGRGSDSSNSRPVYFFKRLFNVDHFIYFFISFFKVFIDSVTSVLCFGFFGPKACGMLAPWPGIELVPSALEGKVLTTGLPGKSTTLCHLLQYLGTIWCLWACVAIFWVSILLSEASIKIYVNATEDNNWYY